MKKTLIVPAILLAVSLTSKEAKAQAQSTSTTKYVGNTRLFTNPFDTRVSGSTPAYIPPRQAPPATSQSFGGLPRSEIRQASREDIIQARARQIYSDRVSRDPRVISVQTGPGATQYFLTYLRGQIWGDSLEQARREVGN
jgi:hypothetical protein